MVSGIMSEQSTYAEADGQRLMVAGVALVLAGLVSGFFINATALPRVAVTGHLVAIVGGIFLTVAGLAWMRLRLGATASRVGAWVAVGAFYCGWANYLVAAAIGAGGMFPLAAGGMRGTPLQEGLVAAAFAAAAAAMIATCVILLWGLRKGIRGRQGRS
jgi:hydroxylaminobenzene mutase